MQKNKKFFLYEFFQKKSLFFIFIFFLICALYSESYGKDLPGSVHLDALGKERGDVVFDKATSDVEVFAARGSSSVGKAGSEFHFLLNDLNIVGNTIYKEGELKIYYADLLKTNITLNQLYKVVEDITRHYRSDGYILSQAIIPKQKIKNGVVTIDVIEGRIFDIEFQQTESSELKFQMTSSELESMKSRVDVAKIKNSVPLLNSVIERSLLLLNDLPGIKAKAVLKPSKEEGAADMVIFISRELVTGKVAIDNYGVENVGPTRASFNASMNSPFGIGRSFGVKVNNAGGKDLQSYHFFTSSPIGNDGVQIFGSFSESAANPRQGVLKDLNVNSYSKLFEFELLYPVLRSRVKNLIFKAGFSSKDFSISLLDEPFTEDKLRTVFFQSKFDQADRLGGLNIIEGEVVHGLAGLGATRLGSVLSSRPEAEPDFMLFRGELLRLQKLNGGLEKFSILSGVSWQWTNEPLFASEEFIVGGRAYGRGNDSGDISGDKGISGKIELQYNEFMANLGYSTLYTFYDYGKVWNLDGEKKLAGRTTDILSSWGLGLRFRGLSGVNASLELAGPLRLTPASQTNKKPRVFAMLAYEF